jgi:hypothetical protein
MVFRNKKKNIFFSEKPFNIKHICIVFFFNSFRPVEKPNYEFVDITKDFFESITELKLGELLHHDFFGLFEAMSAIEMMDPKMDVGMKSNKVF